MYQQVSVADRTFLIWPLEANLGTITGAPPGLNYGVLDPRVCVLWQVSDHVIRSCIISGNVRYVFYTLS